MEKVKTHFFIALHFAMVVVAAPSVSAQDNGPTGEVDQTVNSTGVSKTPEIVTQERKTLWGLLRSGGLMMVPLALLALYGFFKAGVQIYVIIFSNGIEKDRALLEQLDPNKTPWTEMAPTGSSTLILSRKSTEATTRTPAAVPVRRPPIGVIV